MPQTPKMGKRKIGYATPVQTPKKRRTGGLATKSTGSIRLYPSVSSQFVTQNLRYTAYITLNPSIATTAVHVFRANSIFDPDFTGGGAQPRGFDQWMTIYSRYVVVKSKMTCHFTCRAGDGNNKYIAGVGTDTESKGALTSLLDQTEARFVAYTNVEEQQNKMITQTWDLSKWKKSNIMADDSTHGTATTNPSEVWFYNIFAAGTNAGVDPGILDVFATVEYEVRFFDPVVPVSS